ncbi:MAG TPA: N-(5'-phosphoribosyl)anthranilate isomerase, partial [Paracoccus sp. (in: a-proteobacteria)]|nr:N-(5'-phosphoribosyl)anthranilate isomerase [Paracoccus sp. (in: a-proteobacteria)]
MTQPEHVAAAAAAGARYAGFVFFEKSPRNLSIGDAAALVADAPVGLARVGLFVDPSDAQIDAVLDRVPLDIIQ